MMVPAEQLNLGKWFRPPWSQSELWLVIGMRGECVRFGPDRCLGIVTIAPGIPVEVVTPWFLGRRRLGRRRLDECPIGSWIEYDGRLVLVTTWLFAFCPLDFVSVPSDANVMLLDVQIRTDPCTWYIKLWDRMFGIRLRANR